MPLVPYDPLRHLDNWRQDIQRFFNESSALSLSGLREGFGVHRIDVYETENEVVASCEIAGLEKNEDVSINVEGNLLSISGVINRTNEVKEEDMHRRERFSGRFQRSITLPSHVSTEGIRATYRNGILEIRMHKTQDQPKRQIDIDFH
jgi:HSP20 family protein